MKLNRRRGQVAIEYALLSAFVAVAIIGSIVYLEDSTLDFFDGWGNEKAHSVSTKALIDHYNGTHSGPTVGEPIKPVGSSNLMNQLSSYTGPVSIVSPGVKPKPVTEVKPKPEPGVKPKPLPEVAQLTPKPKPGDKLEPIQPELEEKKKGVEIAQGQLSKVNSISKLESKSVVYQDVLEDENEDEGEEDEERESKPSPSNKISESSSKKNSPSAP